jgi:hypothetical protein
VVTDGSAREAVDGIPLRPGVADLPASVRQWWDVVDRAVTHKQEALGHGVA